VFPELFTLDVGAGPLIVRSYETSLLVAALLVPVLGYWIAVRRGLPGRAVALVLLLAALALPVGARIAFSASSGLLDVDLPRRLLAPAWRGFAMDGALFAAVIAGWGACRWQGISTWRLADSLAPALALGLAIMRLGCFLQGCCFGCETSLPWGVVFPWGSPAHQYQMSQGFAPLSPGPDSVHPTQLYELAAALISALLAGWLLRRQLSDGLVILPSALCFLLLRGLALSCRAIAGPSRVTTGMLISVVLLLLITRPPRTRRGSRDSNLPRGTHGNLRPSGHDGTLPESH